MRDIKNIKTMMFGVAIMLSGFIFVFFETDFLLLLTLGAGMTIVIYGHSQNKNVEKEMEVKYRTRNAKKGLSKEDFEVARPLCGFFLKKFYQATLCHAPMNMQPYITNENLSAYVYKKIKSTENWDSAGSLTYFKCEIKEISWNSKQDGIYIEAIVNVRCPVGDLVEIHQFLVKNKKNKLVIVDWYSAGETRSAVFDHGARGQAERIDNPDIWANVEWVAGVFAKAGIPTEPVPWN